MGYEVDTRNHHEAGRRANGDRQINNLNERDYHSEPQKQPLRDSYDSGYEHSWQHLVALRELVEGAD